MKGLVNILKSIVSKTLQTELKSVSGRINLVGGIVLVALIGAVFVEDFMSKVTNVFLLFFQKETLPVFGAWSFLGALAMVGLYFFFCVKTLLAVEKVKK